MVVAVAIVRMVKMTVDKVIDVIAVGHRLMAAGRAMDVFDSVSATLVFRSADGRIRARKGDHVLVDVPFVKMVQMAIVQVVDVIVMLDGSMTAAGLVLMIVIRMRVTGRHRELLLGCS